MSVGKHQIVTVAACALPGFFYQNDGYMQFGFRFSLDYTRARRIYFLVARTHVLLEFPFWIRFRQ